MSIILGAQLKLNDKSPTNNSFKNSPLLGTHRGDLPEAPLASRPGARPEDRQEGRPNDSRQPDKSEQSTPLPTNTLSVLGCT